MTKETLATFKNPIVLLAMGHIVTITCLITVLTGRFLAAVLPSISPPIRKQATQDKPPGADDAQDTALHSPQIFNSQKCLDNRKPWLHTLVWIQATSLDTNLSSDEERHLVHAFRKA
mmetsp:Transcript_11800/g.21484  ORF Transcript_11800/g.21484 Transcript_11800/m.21484 type:complete len:117 (-) Transcript_11800:75-425(-)